MPVFNEEKYLREAIDSILCQTFINFEFIIIDDYSTDNSLQIIQSYADKRIVLIRNESNIGNYPSRNKGLEIAVGKYICVMDADDIAYPQRLELQYTYMEANPDFLAVGTNFVFSRQELNNCLSFSHEQVMISLLYDNAFLHSSLIVRTEVMKKVGGYDEKYIYSSDYDLMSRLALLGKVENLPEILMIYRWHDSQISQLHRNEQRGYADKIRCKYQIGFINRYKSDDQQLPDEWVVGIPQIGQIIALYTYAKYTREKSFERQADELLNQVLENDYKFILSLREERSLCSLGCGLIYIMRNRFVEGEEDEVLAELDRRVSFLSMNWEGEESSLYGWIHYLTLRIDISKNTSVSSCNKQNIIQLLDCLRRDKITDTRLLEDIRKIHVLSIFPERTKRLLGIEKFIDIYFCKEDFPLDDIVTFVIPVRIDSSERQENLNIVLDRLSKRKQTKIIILEADSVSIYKVPDNCPNVIHLFIKDNNPIFYRTKYINILLREANTSIVGIWDADVIVPDDQIDYSIADIRKGKAIMSFPYNGRVNFCSLEDSFIFRHNRLLEFLKEKEHSNYLTCSIGGAFLVHKDYYLEAGGENEHFYGWGMEDKERVKRMEILGLPVSRASGTLFHLFHYKNENSSFYSSRLEEESREEFLKVCRMCKTQLKDYIQTWKNVAWKYENRIYLPFKENDMKIPSDMCVRSPFFSNYFCIMENHNMAFVIIAKNASLHLKNVLVSSIYGFYPNHSGAHSLVGYDDVSPYLCPVSKMQEKEKISGKMLKFAVWRDPVERLVSCYKHFCLEKANRAYFRYLAMYEDNSFDRFLEFVRFELGKKNPLYQDEHIRRQSDYYCPEDVDYIVPIHKLNQFLEEHGVPILRKSANETSVKFQLTDRNQIEEIKKLYKADYEIQLTY